MRSRMNNSLFQFLLWFLALCLCPQAFGKSAGQCPGLNTENDSSQWRVQNAAVICRATCISNSDCTSIKDNCGRMIFANKIFKSEVDAAVKGMAYSCANRFEVAESMESVCENKKCGPKFNSCQAQLKKQNEFIDNIAKNECSTDSDCSFIMVPSEKCVQRIPFGRVSDMAKYSLDLAYLRDGVISACNLKSIKECNSLAKAYCLNKECNMFQEKPPYKNFVNLEGSTYTPNFASNTIPLKLPRASHSKCLQDSECTEVTGICSQYIVALNKKHVTLFKSEMEKMERSIACPVPGKFQVPKSRCFKEFCSFVN